MNPTTSPATGPTTLLSHDAASLLHLLRDWPGQTDLLQKCQTMHAGVALGLVVAGVIYLLWGYYAFRVLVTINAALAGAWLGALAGMKGDAPLAGMVIGGFVAAAVTWPLMKYAVALVGGLIGAVIGISIWRGAGLEPSFAPAGGVIGLVFFGMLSFILFRTSVILFTSFQGSMMLIFGLLGLIYKSDAITNALSRSVGVSPYFLPLCILIAAGIGLLYQGYSNTPGVESKKTRRRLTRRRDANAKLCA